MTPDVVEMVNAIDPNITLPDDWVEIGMALHHEFGDAGFKLWNEWSAQRYEVQAAGDGWQVEDVPQHPAGVVALGTISTMPRPQGGRSLFRTLWRF